MGHRDKNAKGILRDAELAAKASDYYKGGMLASYDPPASTPSDARVPWVQIPL